MTVHAGTAADLIRRERIAYQVSSGLTLQQIGDLNGCSRQYIRQLLGVSVMSLRAPKLRAGPIGVIGRQSRNIRRFWANVNVDPSGCWAWSGATDPSGYGRSYRLAVGDMYAHRAAYLAIKGAIPKGLTLDHLCRNRGCVNPDHLEAVTARENVMRSPIAPAAINARKTHCSLGHELPPVGSSRVRRCATCKTTRHRTPEYRAYKAAYDRRRHRATRDKAA